MHKPSIAQLVYNATFPRPRPNDPASFSAHITRHLVPEVRIETSTFYGSLDCIEAQYPGLDYSYKPHRMRLSRFPWHRRLFRVFDELGLTEAEISSLCRWEGTKSARERYEKEEGVTVRDTTADTIPMAPPTPPPSIEVHYFDDLAEPASESESEVEPSGDVIIDYPNSNGVCIPQEHDSDEEYSDEEMESCGVELNNRLIAASVAREQGADIPLDDAWEQWLKEVSERRGYTDMMNAIRTGQPFSFLSNNPSSSPSSLSSSSSPSPLRYAAATGLLLSSATIAMSTPTSSVVRDPSNHSPSTAL